MGALLLACVQAGNAQANLGVFDNKMVDDAATEIVYLYAGERRVSPLAASPDGRFIAVMGPQQADALDSRKSVYVLPWDVRKIVRPARGDLKADSTPQLDVTLPPLPASPFARVDIPFPVFWPSAGTLIVYTTAYDVVTGGQTPVDLPAIPYAKLGTLDLSPDGQTLVYETGSNEIVTRALSGGPVSGDLSAVAGISQTSGPRWSPDGSRIAITSASTYQTWTIARDGSDVKKIWEPPPGMTTGRFSGWTSDRTIMVSALSVTSPLSFELISAVAAADGSQRIIKAFNTPDRKLGGLFKLTAIPTLPIPPITRVVEPSLKFSGRLALNNRTLRLDGVCSGDTRCSGVLVLTYKRKRIVRYSYDLAPDERTHRRTFKLSKPAQRVMRKAPKFSYPKARIGMRLGPGSDIKSVGVRRF